VALLDRYGTLAKGNAYEQLTTLMQTREVEQYIRDFKLLTAQIPNIPEPQYFTYFLHVLREDIKGRVRSLYALGSMSRPWIMNVARAVEMELKGRGKMGFPQEGERHVVAMDCTWVLGRMPPFLKSGRWVLTKEAQMDQDPIKRGKVKMGQETEE